MLSRLLLAAALTALSTPALAHGPADHQAGDPVPAGCVRAHVHVPAGKIAHAPAPIRCGEPVRMVAAASHPRAPLAAPSTAQD